MKLYYHKHEFNPGMRYVAAGGWRPFAFLQHGGWFYASLRHPIRMARWWWRFCVVIPKSRGWRWD